MASRRCVQLVRKVKFPVPIHLLDNLIIPVNACNDHWFPAHLNVAKRQLRFLDSSKNYSAREYTGKEMLMWKFYRLAWMVHAYTEDPPTWAINPEEVRSPQGLLTTITLEMKQNLQMQQNPTVNDIVKVIGMCTVETWGGKGVYLLEAVQLEKHWTRWTPSKHLSRTTWTSRTRQQQRSRVEYTQY